MNSRGISWLTAGLVVSIGMVVPMKVGALSGVGAKIDQVSNGSLVSVNGWHAPGSEIIVEANGEVVAGALENNNGQFSFSFRVDANQVGQLRILAEDQAAITRPIAIPGVGSFSALLPPSIVEDTNAQVAENSVVVGGYSYPGATIRVELSYPDGRVESELVAAAGDGGWQILYEELAAGRYTVVAYSSALSRNSEVSDQIEILVTEPVPVVVRPATQVGDTVSRVVENVAQAVLPPLVQDAVREVAPQARQVTETVAPVTAAGLLTQLALIARDVWFFVVQSAIAGMQYFGLWKKRHPWGIVYDAVTKQPIMLATVRLYSRGKVSKLVETDVTSKVGMFSFFPKAGSYLIKVAKTGYSFPSKLVRTNEDGEYGNVYHGEAIRFKEAKQVVDVAIPIDPAQVVVDWKFKLRNFFRTNIYRLTIVSLMVGWVMSLLAALGGEGGLNGFFLLFYSMMLVFQGYSVYSKRRAWGMVVDRRGKPVPGVQVDLVNPQFKNLVQRRVTDESGKYQFVVPEGKYAIKISSLEHRLVTNVEKVYQGQEIHVVGDRPKLIRVKVMVEPAVAGEKESE